MNEIEIILNVERLEFLEDKLQKSTGIMAFVNKLSEKVPRDHLRNIIDEWMKEE